MCLFHAGFRTDGEGSQGGPTWAPGAVSPGDEVAALYSELGRDVARAVDGSLAFVLWDPRSSCLLAVRDRLGVHPWYFTLHGKRLLLSHAAAGLDLEEGGTRPRLRSLVAHLQGVPAPPGDSFLEGVEQVEAGEIVRFDRRGTQRWTYWRAEPTAPVPSANDVPGTVLETLRAAVAASCPPGFGVTLSGGLDSGSVAAVLAERAEEPVPALTWSFPLLPEADETAPAAEVARRLGLCHEVLRADDLWPFRESAPRPPLEQPSQLPFPELWLAACRRARELGLPGLATGAGGDHLFGFCGAGAYAYPDLLLTGRWGELVRQIRAHRGVSPAPLSRIIDVDLVRPLVRAVLPSRLVPSNRPAPWLRREHHGTARDLVADVGGLGSALPGVRHRRRALRSRSLPPILLEIGRLAQQAGIEVRHPLLDRRLVELAAALPSTAGFRAGYYKPVLRDALCGRLPAATLERRQKILSSALFHRGLRGESVGTIRRLLSDMRAADLGLVEPGELRRRYDEYLEGDDDTRFWSALTLEQWLRAHF